MNRPLCSFVSAMRFGAPQRQDIENPSCRSVRFDLRGLFYTFTTRKQSANSTLVLSFKQTSSPVPNLITLTLLYSSGGTYHHVQHTVNPTNVSWFKSTQYFIMLFLFLLNDFHITTSMTAEPQESTVYHKYTPTCQVYTCICTPLYK